MSDLAAHVRLTAAVAHLLNPTTVQLQRDPAADALSDERPDDDDRAHERQIETRHTAFLRAGREAEASRYSSSWSTTSAA